jgi:hypothetical protein
MLRIAANAEARTGSLLVELHQFVIVAIGGRRGVASDALAGLTLALAHGAIVRAGLFSHGVTARTQVALALLTIPIDQCAIVLAVGGGWENAGHAGAGIVVAAAVLAAKCAVDIIMVVETHAIVAVSG